MLCPKMTLSKTYVYGTSGVTRRKVASRPRHAAQKFELELFAKEGYWGLLWWGSGVREWEHVLSQVAWLNAQLKVH